jgi:hypothetical protein
LGGDVWVFSINNNPTRNNRYKLKAINYKTGILGNLFTYREVNLWNRLPAEVLEAETLGAFRERLDKVFDDLKWGDPVAVGVYGTGWAAALCGPGG